MTPLKITLNKSIERLNELFGSGLVMTMGAIIILGLTISIAAYLFTNTAAPRTLTITGGPAGSIFQRNAEKYQKILAREGVKLKILPSDGSSENLKRLADPKTRVDIGFVLGGEARGRTFDTLVSLGAVSFQPLMLFHSGPPLKLLSEFQGKRLNIGPDGSGTHTLALALLKANGIEAGGDTRLDASDPADPAEELRAGRVDAVFLMGDSTATSVLRGLLRADGVHLFNFVQADGYVRRINTLNKLTLPRGALDLGKDIPPEDVSLIGPTVELVARDSLHPALSDLLLEAAREVHGTAGIFRKSGEFPVAVDGEFRTSPDATRYYASGKSFLYRTMPFWLASILVRVFAVLLPIIFLLVPALRIAPAIYRWRVESRIYRWYRVLLELERDALKPDVDAARREELLRQLDHIETAVNRIAIPASFGDLFYVLRGHIRFVRANLLAAESVSEAAVPGATPAPS